MSLKKIRELYLSLQIDTKRARAELFHAGIEPKAADELMLLWVGDEWELSVKRGPGTHRVTGGRR